MNSLIPLLCVVLSTISNANENPPETLEFGFMIVGEQNTDYQNVFDISLSHGVTWFEVTVHMPQPIVPGNYFWAGLDSMVVAAHDASISCPEYDARIIMHVSNFALPDWCWTYYYGTITNDNTWLSDWANMDVLIDYHRRLAQRYKPNGDLAQMMNWADSWGVNHFNLLGEVDLTWKPCEYINGEPVKITPAEMDLEGLADAYKTIRAAIVESNPNASVILSFLTSPYQENWPRDQFWPTGLGLGEFTQYMTLFYQQFDCNDGYNRYPDAIDWHGYPRFFDTLCNGTPVLWEDNQHGSYSWIPGGSLSDRAFQHDSLLDAFSYTDCELMVVESGTTPFWNSWIREIYRTGRNQYIGHIAFQLTTLAEMAANNRTSLLQMALAVTGDSGPDVEPGYDISYWWDASFQEVDLVFLAYTKMAALLTGKTFESRNVLTTPSSLNTVVSHVFKEPDTQQRVYQLRSTQPTLPGYGVTVNVPVNSRYVNIIPAVGNSRSYDCGPLDPYIVTIDIGWLVTWIEETDSPIDSQSCTEDIARIAICGVNPVSGNADISIRSTPGIKKLGILVFDITGRIIQQATVEPDPNGKTTFSFDFSATPAGVYFLTSDVTNSSVVRFTVIH